MTSPNELTSTKSDVTPQSTGDFALSIADDAQQLLQLPQSAPRVQQPDKFYLPYHRSFQEHFKCQQCEPSIVFTGKSKIKLITEHMLNDHNKVVGWECCICGLRNDSIGSIGLHFKKCSIRQPAKAEALIEENKIVKVAQISGRYEFVTATKETDGPLECKQCRVTFYGSSRTKAIKDHLVFEHGVTDVIFECPTCMTYKSENFISVRGHAKACKNKMCGVPPKDNSKSTTINETALIQSRDETDNVIDVEQAADNLNSALNSSCGDGAIELSTSLTRHSDDNVENPLSDQESPGFAGGVELTGHESSMTSTLQSCATSEHDHYALDCLVEPTVFTVAEAYEFVTDVLGKEDLHPRYRSYLENERRVLRHKEGPPNGDFVDAAASRYEQYLRCGRSTEVPITSRAREMGLRIIKLSRGPRQALCAIAYHVLGNPSLWKKVSSKALTEVQSNMGYYQKVALSISDASVPLEVHLGGLQKGTVVSPLFVMFAAAAAYSCDFTVHSPFDKNERRIFCPGVGRHVYNIWIDDSGTYPCVRLRGLNRFQERGLKRRRNRALYFANTSRLAAEVFKDAERRECPLGIDHTVDHYRKLFEGDDRAHPGNIQISPATSETITDERWPSITVVEVQNALKGVKTSSAPGPDRITVRDIRAFDPCLVGMTLLFNFVMQTGRPPQSWLESKTLLLPKASASPAKLKTQSGWRPITISSILMRILHRILVGRLRRVCSLDEGQTAFDPSACFANLLTLRSVVREKRANKQPLAVAVLDVKSAFDTVSHGALEEALRTKGCPQYLSRYVMNTFRGSCTRIRMSNSRPSDPIRFLRGVKQGDPLSPLLFAICVDEALQEVRNLHLGSQLKGGIRLSHLVYADDVLLIADDYANLQKTIDILQAKLKENMLFLSPEKCQTYRQSYRCGKLVVDRESDIRINGVVLKSIIEGDPVKYLGGTPWKETTLDEAQSELENLFAVASSALVSPTQAAHLLNDYAVPSLLAKLGASWDISSTNLRRIDELWRSKLKNLLKLPRNLSDGAFYLPLSKGGLGFRSLEHEVQCTRLNALRAVLDKFGGAIDLRKEIGSVTDHLKKLSDQPELSQVNPRGLFQKYCIQKWKDATTQALGHECFTEGLVDRSLISFRYRQGRHSSYVEHVKLRLQLLEVGSVLNRMDHQRGKSCRRCTAKVESCSHVLNGCEYTSAIMTRRHDKVQSRLTWTLAKRPGAKFEVWEQNRFHDEAGNLHKPDLILRNKSSGKVFIADVAVYYETGRDRGEAVMKGKEDKYAPIVPVVAAHFKVEQHKVATIGLAVGSRGTFTQSLLRRLKLLSIGNKTALNMAKTAAEQSLAVFHVFMGRRRALRDQ